jgi:hypothetical protein
MARDFYSTLPALAELRDMVAPDNYIDLPEDWIVVLTDVKGSTKAIEEGRYKEVNTIGVSCIIAVQNVLEKLEFPFIFGGDGATLAVPPEFRQGVEQALSHARCISREEFGLDLRIAIVPAREVRAAGGELKVAKVTLSSTQKLAVLRGAGWSLAEAWMKEREDQYSLPESVPAVGSMTGLECRWNPLPARKDEVMALIIQSRLPGLEGFKTYQALVEEIFKPGHKPIGLSELRFPWPPRFLLQEARVKTPQGLARTWYFIKMLGWTLLISLMMTFRGKKKNLEQPFEYLSELTENTDYLKFDESLRMIIDVTVAEREELLKILNKHYRDGEIFYGWHCDPAALLTCFVQGPHQHIHFVDAAGGGYALAAKKLKAQKKIAN